MSVLEMDYEELLRSLKNAKTSEISGYLMGITFDDFFNQTDAYSMDLSDGTNLNRISSQELANLASELNSVRDGDTAAYLEKWEAFETAYNVELPDLPLFAAKQYTFAGKRVHGLAEGTFAEIVPKLWLFPQE